MRKRIWISILLAAILALCAFALCSCGGTANGDYTTYEELPPHTMENGECIECHTPESTPGLEYQFNSDSKSYTVTGIGTCTESDIVIGIYNGYSVTSIGEDAFAYCYNLASIVIPDSVISIGSSAFYRCTSLTSVTIGNGVTSIGSSAFYYCYNLTSVKIGNGVTSIGDYAFYNCTSLTSVVIPDSVTSIGDCAFEDCYDLVSIVIPDNVTSIGDYAFASCESLTSVVIPDSVTSIGLYAFPSHIMIYCEATSKPSGWNSNWNYSDRRVVWGYKAD